MIIPRSPSTYRIGLIHTKLNRLLKQRMTKALTASGINPPEWSLLGVLFESSKGIRLRELAEELGVEASFVTTMAKSLSKRKFIELVTDPDDNRAKEIKLSPEGRTFVERTEKQLRESLRPLIDTVPLKNLMTYFSVIQKLVDNVEATEK